MSRSLPDPINYNETSGNTVLDRMCDISEGMRIEGALVLERWLRQDEPELKGVALTTLAALLYSHMQNAAGYANPAGSGVRRRSVRVLQQKPKSSGSQKTPGIRRASSEGMSTKIHWSDCAVNNGPAYEAGPCDCGGLFSLTDNTAEPPFLGS